MTLPIPSLQGFPGTVSVPFPVLLRAYAPTPSAAACNLHLATSTCTWQHSRGSARPPAQVVARDTRVTPLVAAVVQAERAGGR